MFQKNVLFYALLALTVHSQAMQKIKAEQLEKKTPAASPQTTLHEQKTGTACAPVEDPLLKLDDTWQDDRQSTQAATESTASVPPTAPLRDHLDLSYLSPSWSRQLSEHKSELTSPSDDEPKVDTAILTSDLCRQILADSPQEIKKIVAMITENKHDLASDLHPKRWLFVGPPGTGKTSLAKAIAQEAGIPCLSYNAASIANQYKDSGPKNLEKIFEKAAKCNGPCILVIDELEALIQKHNNKNDTESGMLTRLWSLLDQSENSSIIFIGTLNDAKEAPEQIKSRFRQFIITVPLPNMLQRKEILSYYISLHTNAIFEEETASMLALYSQGLSHRDLKALITKIVFEATAKKYNKIAPTQRECLDVLMQIKKTNRDLQKNNYQKNALRWLPTALTGVGICVSAFSLYQNKRLHEENVKLQQMMHAFQKAAFEQQTGWGAVVKQCASQIFSTLVSYGTLNKFFSR